MKKNEDKKAIDPDIAALSFEEALAELEKFVRRLEEGKTNLDDAIKSYERGAMLKKHCEAKLREAQARIEKITTATNGIITAEPINL